MLRNALMRKQRSETIITGFILLIAAFLTMLSGLLTRVDLQIFDAGQRLLPRQVPHDIVIIAIDEESLAHLGSWPWTRDTHARLLDRLCPTKPAVIGFDVAFSEPAQNTEYDQKLAKAIARCGNVVLPMVIETMGVHGQFIETPPIQDLIPVIAGFGRVGVRIDEDGIFRSVYLREGIDTPVWPLFSDELLRVAQRSPLQSSSERTTEPSYRLIQRDLRLVEFAGPPGTIPQIPYSQVLEQDVPANFFTGKTVLIGATAAGLSDFLPTPLSALARPMSGVEAQANIWLSMRHGLFSTPVPSWVRALICSILALIPLLWLARISPLYALILSILWVAIIIVCSALLPYVLHYWMPPSGALVPALLAFPVWSWRRLESARRHLSQELRQLALFLPRKVSAMSDQRLQRSSFEQQIHWVQGAQRQMQALEEKRKETLAFISHDLRSPIATAIQYLESVEQYEPAKILPSLHRAQLMAQQFLLLSRTEMLDIQEMQELDLIAILHQAIDEVFNLARQHGIRIARKLPDDPLWIRGEFSAIERCAINLLQNAIKYAPADSTIEAGLKASKNNVSFWIENEGEAIPPKQAEKLFQRFKRGRNTTSKMNPEGTGLGLYYVHMVAEKHGGKASLHCANGKIRFTIQLPRLPETPHTEYL